MSETEATALDTPLSALHRSHRATMATWFGCQLPDHWPEQNPEQNEDPRVEQSFAMNSVALIDKNYRAYLSFSGPDRVRYLNAILTNNIKDLGLEHGIISLLLNPQGHILAEVETYALQESLFCVSYAMIRSRLVEWLEKYIIMDDVTLTDETERYGTLALEGPRATSAAQELIGRDPSALQDLQREEATIASIPCTVVKRSSGGTPGYEFLTARERLPELWQILFETARRHGGGPMGYAALSAQRLMQGIPWFGYDFGEKQIPHEAGLQDSHISYTKGCYTGQEIVERVRSRGHVNRQRVDLVFSGTRVPAAGDTLAADGKEVGYVTRAALPFSVPYPIGMGYVRHENSSPGTSLAWPGGTATVSKFPEAFLSAGTAR